MDERRLNLRKADDVLVILNGEEFTILPEATTATLKQLSTYASCNHAIVVLYIESPVVLGACQDAILWVISPPTLRTAQPRHMSHLARHWRLPLYDPPTLVP